MWRGHTQSEVWGARPGLLVTFPWFVDLQYTPGERVRGGREKERERERVLEDT